MRAEALIASVAFHVAVIVAVSVAIPFGVRFDPEDLPQVIAIDVVSIGAETVVKAPEKKEPAPEEDAVPTPAALPQEAPETTEEIDEPEPTLAQEAAAPPEPEPEPVPAEPEPKKEPVKPKEEPKKDKPKIDEAKALENLAALVDRSKEQKKQSVEELENKLFASFDKKPVSSSSKDSREESMSLVDAARSQVQKCWSPPTGALNASQMRVSVTVLLAPDGNVLGEPQLDPADRRRMNRSNETVFRVFAESALRAVRQCAPYNLPKERFQEWQSLRLNFDPSQMLQ